MFDDVPTDQPQASMGTSILLLTRVFADISLQANTVQETGRFLARLDGDICRVAMCTWSIKTK